MDIKRLPREEWIQGFVDLEPFQRFSHRDISEPNYIKHPNLVCLEAPKEWETEAAAELLRRYALELPIEEAKEGDGAA